MVAGLVAFAATLALFGTVLPSIVLGGTIDAAAALWRGRSIFWPTAGWLLAGPGIFWVALIAAQVGLSYAGLPPTAYDEATGEVFWPGAPLLILVEFAVLYANLLGAAVLCRAYFRGEAAT